MGKTGKLDRLLRKESRKYNPICYILLPFFDFSSLVNFILESSFVERNYYNKIF